eukprot:351894_1
MKAIELMTVTVCFGIIRVLNWRWRYTNHGGYERRMMIRDGSCRFYGFKSRSSEELPISNNISWKSIKARACLDPISYQSEYSQQFSDQQMSGKHRLMKTI